MYTFRVIIFNGYSTIKEAFVTRGDDFAHRPLLLLNPEELSDGMYYVCAYNLCPISQRKYRLTYVFLLRVKCHGAVQQVMSIIQYHLSTMIQMFTVYSLIYTFFMQLKCLNVGMCAMACKDQNANLITPTTMLMALLTCLKQTVCTYLSNMIA